MIEHWEYIPFLVIAYVLGWWKIAHDFFMWTSGLKIWADKQMESRGMR